MTNEDIKSYLWARCTRCDKCLLWDGAVDDAGVPQTRLPGQKKTYQARRELLKALGVSVDKRVATTTCGNPRCMDEKHVAAWTRKRLQKRSAQTFASNAARSLKLAIAARKSVAVLTIEQVREMRVSGMTGREAAAHYGVALSTAQKALSGDSWKEYSTPFAGLGAR
jgi:hypothetical protein